MTALELLAFTTELINLTDDHIGAEKHEHTRTHTHRRLSHVGQLHTALMVSGITSSIFQSGPAEQLKTGERRHKRTG